MEIKNEIELIDILKNTSPKQGIELILKYENLITKKYYEVTTYKIKFLMALDKYLEAKMIINEELKAPYIPHDFQVFLEDSNRKLDEKFQIVNKDENKDIDFENLDKLDNNSLLKTFPLLEKYDVKLYLEPLTKILISDNFSNSIKSLILALLNLKKVNAKIKVIKNSKEYFVNPLNIKDIRETNSFLYLENKINERHDISKNILDLALQLINLYLLDIYPEELDNSECDVLFASLIDISLKMLNSSSFYKDIELIIIKNKNKVDYYQEKVNNLLKGI